MVLSTSALAVLVAPSACSTAAQCSDDAAGHANCQRILGAAAQCQAGSCILTPPANEDAGIPPTPEPTLMLAAPRLACAGAFTTLRGRGFGARAAEATLRFGETTAEQITSWSDAEVRVRVPKETHGLVDVTLEVGGRSVSARLRVLPRIDRSVVVTNEGYAAALRDNADVAVWFCRDAAGACPAFTRANYSSLGGGTSWLVATHDGGYEGRSQAGQTLFLPEESLEIVHTTVSDGNVYAMTGARQERTAHYWRADTANATDVRSLFGGAVGLVSLRAGNSFVLGLQDTGHIVSFRHPNMTVDPAGFDCGQATVPPLDDVVAIATGQAHALALRDDGTVVLWGGVGCRHAPPAAALQVPPSLDRVVAISAGADHNLALRDDGTVVGFGNDLAARVTGPMSMQNVVVVSAGARGSVVVTDDGRAHAFGSDYANIPADLRVQLP